MQKSYKGYGAPMRTYAVQVSQLNKYNIITSKYNLVSKADAIKWAVEHTRRNQYGTIVSMPNYFQLSHDSRNRTSKSVLAYERGTIVGEVRWFGNVPVVIDEIGGYMWDINPNYRLVNKREISKPMWKVAVQKKKSKSRSGPLAELDKAYSQTQKELRKLK